MTEKLTITEKHCILVKNIFFLKNGAIGDLTYKQLRGTYFPFQLK
jgi:hypothetical protein